MNNDVQFTYEKQVRAIITYGDIRGFSAWEQSCTTPEIEFKPLMNRFDFMVKEFAEHTGYYTKALGDGFMQVIELPEGSASAIALHAMKLTWNFAWNVHTLFRKSDWPRPAGFRIRRSVGRVWKKEGPNQDYVGRHCNMTNKLLRVYPDTFWIDHQSAVELSPRATINRNGFRYEKLEPEQRQIDGILKVDMHSIWKLSHTRNL